MIPDGNPKNIFGKLHISANIKPSTFMARVAQVNVQKHPRRVLLRRRLRADRTLTTSALLCTSNEKRKGNQERKRERKKERDRERERERPAHSSAVALTSLSLSLCLSRSLSLSLSLSPSCLSLSLSRLSVKPMSLSLSLSLYLSPVRPRSLHHGRALCQSAPRPNAIDVKGGRSGSLSKRLHGMGVP